MDLAKALRIIEGRLQELKIMKAATLEHGDYNRVKYLEEIIDINLQWLGALKCLEESTRKKSK